MVSDVTNTFTDYFKDLQFIRKFLKYCFVLHLTGFDKIFIRDIMGGLIANNNDWTVFIFATHEFSIYLIQKYHASLWLLEFLL